MKKQALVNIYHFIRKSTYQDGVFTQEDFDTLKNEMDIIKQHHLPATYALKYDALMDERYIKLIKDTVEAEDEVAAWWEMTEALAKKAGVKWKGTDVIDLHVKAGYSLAYTPEERKAMLDVYMEDFKGIYGDYPKTIASWVMDIVSFTYAKERYGVIGGGLCRDQIGIDGFTLWGGYFNGPYYPSKQNEYMVAQTKENQLDMPIFKLLGPDPIYNFESGIREGAEGIYTLEPAWIAGQSKVWVSWLFDCLTEEEQLGFGYAQVGQENSFIWGNVGEGFEMQMRHIAHLREENKIRVETLRDSAKWFCNKYHVTPPTTYTASKDWNKVLDLKTTWYNSRFYRTSFLWDREEMCIRDFYIFDETYPSRYLKDYIETNESLFDALPLLDTHAWRTPLKRATIDFLDGQSLIKLKGESPVFEAQDDLNWKIVWALKDSRQLDITCQEEKICFTMKKGEVSQGWQMRLNTLPVLVALEEKRIICKHENHSYEVNLEKGYFKKDQEAIFICSEENTILLNLVQNKKALEENIFTQLYRQDQIAFEQKEMEKPVIDKEKLKNIKLIKPVLSHRKKVKGYEEISWCEMTNPNNCGTIRYTLDASEPMEDSACYKEALAIHEDTQVKAKVFAENRRASDIAEATYYNTIKIKNITSQTKFDPRQAYNRKGVYDLIDGKKGSLNYVDGCWLATTDYLDVIADLGEIKEIKTIHVSFMQSKRSGPYYPEYVTYSVSKEGIKFDEIGKEKVHEESTDPDIGICDVRMACSCEARYIRIEAKPYEGKFIFVDQIMVQR